MNNSIIIRTYHHLPTGTFCGGDYKIPRGTFHGGDYKIPRGTFHAQ